VRAYGGDGGQNEKDTGATGRNSEKETDTSGKKELRATPTFPLNRFPSVKERKTRRGHPSNSLAKLPPRNPPRHFSPAPRFLWRGHQLRNPAKSCVNLSHASLLPCAKLIPVQGAKYGCWLLPTGSRSSTIVTRVPSPPRGGIIHVSLAGLLAEMSAHAEKIG
jgi:hypothetical protein